MWKPLLAVFITAIVLLLTGCASLRPGVGVLYSNVSDGIDATANQAGNRMGEACATSYLGLIATGDASIENARRNGAITMITSVDYTANNFFIFYSKYCTIVRGR